MNGPNTGVVTGRNDTSSVTANGSSLTSSFTTINGSATSSTSFLSEEAIQEQMKALAEELMHAKRIREGAENLLRVQEIKGNPIRSQVESELDSAKAKIESLVRKMEKLSQSGRKKSDSGASRRKFAGQVPSVRAVSREDPDDRGDFRTALQDALNHMHALSTLARSDASTGTNTTGSPSSSSSMVASSTQVEKNRTDTMVRLTTILQRNLRVRYEVNTSEILQDIMPALSDHATKESRAAAYRLIRHTLINMDSVLRLRDQHLDWYIIRSLARDNKYVTEKEQVLKLLRAIIEIGSEGRAPHMTVGSGKVPLSEGVMRAIIATAEQADDPFRKICIQTLVEILLVDTELVARTGGMRTLLHVLAEGQSDLAPLLSTAFLYIIDSPRTRVYLTPGTELEIVLSGITDAYGKGIDHVERMKACTRIVAMMFRTWSGLIYFCFDDMAAVRSVISVLQIPSLETREIVLDLFFDLLNIKTPSWYQTFIDGRRLTVYRRSGQNFDKRQDIDGPRLVDTMNITDQYIALMLLVFIKAGLLDAITSMLEETTVGTNLSRKAMLLMAEVLHLANRLLPLDIAAKVQAIPRLFDMASDRQMGENRIIGTLALSALDSFNRHRIRMAPPVATPVARPRANSVEDAMRRGQRQVEQAKIKMGKQMDDKTFQATLLETNVMMTKDHTKWNFDVLQDLIEGPLLNQKRMEEAVKLPKFLGRLMFFFHPFSNRFSEMPRKGNSRWVKLGISLLTTLLANAEGQRFLMNEDAFVSDIVRGFAQLDPYNPSPLADPLFSKRRMEETLTYSYIEMLGTLSKSKEGIEIMEKHKVFTAFYHLMELKSREDLMVLIVETLDYSIDGHPRIVLSKALTSHYKGIRLFATNHLGELIRRSPTPKSWTLRLLITQLYDPMVEVCQAAVRYLEEACEDLEVLQIVMEMQPTFEHLGELAHPLLLKAMSTQVGFRYLHEAGYIDTEIDMWFHERNIAYVVQVEVFLAQAFGFSLPDPGEDILTFEGAAPPHFYGEMVKTELGAAVLHEKGHFAEFAGVVRRHGLEADDADVVMRLKSVLWAIGNIGAAEGGLPFLEDEDIIPNLLEIAEKSPILSIRGTCFLILGLISSTPLGSEILIDYGWEATLSPLGLPTGMVVPTALDRFISIPSWKVESRESDDRLTPPSSDYELEVMTAIHNLSNAVIANTASRSLAKMKSKPEFRAVFSSASMFYRALHVISTQKYRSPVRRYILELFDLVLDSDLVTVLVECTSKLQLPPATPASSPTARSRPARPMNPRVFSVIGRKRRTDDSDEDDESDGDGFEKVLPERPVMRLRPMSRIVGFPG